MCFLIALAFTILFIPAVECRGEKSELSSLALQAQGNDPLPRLTFAPTTAHPSSQNKHRGHSILNSSKISAALLRRTSVSPTADAIVSLTTAPTPTAMPSLMDELPYTVHSEGSAMTSSDVRCVPRQQSKERNSFTKLSAQEISIDLPYYYQVEMTHDNKAGSLVKRIGSHVLVALAKKSLACVNGERDETEKRTRAIAAVAVSQDTAYNGYHCSRFNYTCFTVEGTITITLKKGDKSHLLDSSIASAVSEAYTVLKLTLVAFDDQSTAYVNYLGRDPFSLASNDGWRVGAHMSIFVVIFLAISICGTASIMVVLLVFLQSYRTKKSGATLDSTLPVSGNDIPLHHCCSIDQAMHLVIADEERSTLHSRHTRVQSKSSVLPSPRLVAIPEGASISDFECEDMRV